MNREVEVHKLYLLNVVFNFVLNIIFKNFHPHDRAVYMIRNQYRTGACKFGRDAN
jgi:hypothetical protein